MISGTCSATPELVSDAGYDFNSPDPPALGVDSQDNMFVAWGDIQLLTRQRIAATGEWEPITETNHNQWNGLDLVVDQQDVPHWISGSGAEHENHIWVNNVDIVDGYVYDSGGPTIALGPGGVHVAVWSAQRSQGGDIRLFMAPHNPGGPVTKHYYAGGQRITTRVDGVLYYLHGDMLGSTVLVTNQASNQVGQVFYDPWGQVITNTLPLTLTDRLFTGL